MLSSHLEQAAQGTSNVIRTYTNQWGSFEVRESLLAGPGGFLKFESTWQVLDNGVLRFITAIPFGGI